MQVKKLTETADLERYVDFARDVYRENSYWVPPDKHHLMALLGGNSGFGPQSNIQPFAVEDGNRILATVAASQTKTTTVTGMKSWATCCSLKLCQIKTPRSRR